MSAERKVSGGCSSTALEVRDRAPVSPVSQTGRGRSLPCTRAAEPGIRRARLVAARGYPRGSVPRAAILLGHWDGGSVVGAARERP